MASLRSRARTALVQRVGNTPVEVRRWPHDPTIAHLVLLDVSVLPTLDDIGRLTERTFADDPEVRAIRTSALFPGPRERFAEAGYDVCERLALLERAIDRIAPVALSGPPPAPAGAIRLRRLTQRRLDDAARIDRAAFPPGWSNSEHTLADIAGATPRHRARLAVDDTSPVGFAITGLAGHVGYLQRLAVDPDHQRRGIARLLVDDALAWLQRRGGTTALVNTGVDNEPALALYRQLGFRHRRDELVVMERSR